MASDQWPVISVQLLLEQMSNELRTSASRFLLPASGLLPPAFHASDSSRKSSNRPADATTLPPSIFHINAAYEDAAPANLEDYSAAA